MALPTVGHGEEADLRVDRQEPLDHGGLLLILMGHDTGLELGEGDGFHAFTSGFE